MPSAWWIWQEQEGLWARTPERSRREISEGNLLLPPSLLTWRRYEGRGFSPFSSDLIWLGVSDWKSGCSLSNLDLSELIFQKDDSSSGLRASLTDTFRGID